VKSYNVKPRRTINATQKLNKNHNSKNKTKKGGTWWPFSKDITATSQTTYYDKYIDKYKAQIDGLKKAIKVLDEKIAKVEIAKQSDQSISQEKAKIENLTKQKNEALVGTNTTGITSWFSGLMGK
jgi:seryl-tRNA synthetase